MSKLSITKDRLQRLLDPANTTINGIDYVEIASMDERTLRVHFLNKVDVKGKIGKAEITGGETIPTVVVKPVNDATDWNTDGEGRPILTLNVPAPGDFSTYTLTLFGKDPEDRDNPLDLDYRSSRFSFKALCPSDLDCATPATPCPPETADVPPIDYLAKDFLSFRKALLDFSALRYPEWQERSEADFGVMFVEALSALADDLSYMQDRVAAEATLETATQRRSLMRLARLVDYEPTPALASRVLLQLKVQKGVSEIPALLGFNALAPDGTRIDFETGDGLLDPVTGLPTNQTFPVDEAWNGPISPYFLDAKEACLEAGATSMWVAGHGHNFVKGMALLINTRGDTTADPPIREVVHLDADGLETFDPLFSVSSGPPSAPTPITRIRWSAAVALQFDHDLTRTVIAGNLVPATQGRTVVETFAIDTPPASAPQTPLALARTGPDQSGDAPQAQYLFTLNQTPLAWLAPTPDAGEEPVPQPEILLTRQTGTAPKVWTFRRTLLKAEHFENAYTVDPMRYTRIAQNSDGSRMYDYDSDNGDTIRFGDGVFGGKPEPNDLFSVTYRVGGGVEGNVAPDSITGIGLSATALVATVTNPFPATCGADAESAESIRRLAPQAFRAKQYRAVRPEDYVDAAETLPWVLRAGTQYRYTGSWLTVFTTADPKGSETIPVEEHADLIDLLNRRRLAGYESYVPAPIYLAVDLIVTVCVRPDAFRGDAKAAVLRALSASKMQDGTTGFFYYDNFSFGQPLERSALESAIQNAYGVAGVVSILYRTRGSTPIYKDLPEVIRVAQNQILRVDNDPSRPDRGSLRVIVEGGK